MTVQSYAKSINILTYRITALGVYFGFDAIRFSKLIADWSFKDMNPDLTPLIVIVSREKKRIQHLILSRLILIIISLNLYII